MSATSPAQPQGVELFFAVAFVFPLAAIVATAVFLNWGR